MNVSKFRDRRVHVRQSGEQGFRNLCNISLAQKKKKKKKERNHATYLAQKKNSCNISHARAKKKKKKKDIETYCLLLLQIFIRKFYLEFDT